MLHPVRPPSPRVPVAPFDPVVTTRPLPTRAELAALDVDPFLHRLEHNLSAITADSSLAALLPPDAPRELTADPRFADADALFRSTLRGLLVATSFRDLPEPARLHPAVQDHMWSAMDEMDTAVGGVAGALSSLTAAERTEINRALRDQPDLGARVLAVLDAEAAKAGISPERRDHLRSIGQQATFRLRQSTTGFIDEYAGKVQRSRPRPPAEAERYLAAQLGETSFQQERTWHLAVAAEWQTLLAEQNAHLSSGPDSEGDSGGGISADDAYAPPAGHALPPPLPPGGRDPNSGLKVLKVGAGLFGFAVFSGILGAILISTGNDNAVLAGLFSFTAAALLSVAGLICLIVGAILRIQATSRARAEYTLP